MRLRGWTVATSWTVTILWSLVSVGVAISSLVALSLPTWFIRTYEDSGTSLSFGVWWWARESNPEYTRNSNHLDSLTPYETQWIHRIKVPTEMGNVDQEEFTSGSYYINSSANTPIYRAENNSFPQASALIRNPLQGNKYTISEGASVWIIVGAMYGGAAVVLAVTGVLGPIFLLLLRGKERSSATRLVSNLQAAAGTANQT